MSQSLNCNYLHIVFSTKHRQHLILPEFEDYLYRYITGISKNFNSPVICINGVADHLHILVRLSSTISVAKLVEEIKKNSSKWIKQQYPGNNNFYWQNGYGAFSVSPKHLESVKAYIDRQKQHHANDTYQAEFIRFLKSYELSYDERFLWD
jgi:REP element-mobilizing transposase RayT